MIIKFSLLFTPIALLASACNNYTSYENRLITDAKGIESQVITRDQLINTFNLQEVQSEVYSRELKNAISINPNNKTEEVWRLPNNYQLIAYFDGDLKESAESKRMTTEWLKTATKRDFFVTKFDPISSFENFKIFSRRGRHIYSSQNKVSANEAKHDET